MNERITRRKWLALGSLAVGEACRRKKGTGFAGYALIATSGEESVAVVDLTTFRLQKPIPVGARPTAVVTGAPANHSFILTSSNGGVHIVDGNLKIVRSGKLSDEISVIRVAPESKRLLAISALSRELIEADSSSLQVIRRHRLEAEPAGLDVGPGSWAAVSTGEHGTVELFDLNTGQQRRAQVAGRIGAVRFRADGQRLLVANLQDSGLIALTVPGLEVIANLPLAMQPENLCFKPDQGQLFVSGAGMDGVAIVFPYTPLEVEQTILAGRDPGVMACSAGEPAYLFVGSNSGSDVCVLNIRTRRVMGFVDVGQRPTYITTTPDSQYALILDESAGAMAVIRIPAIRVDWRSFAAKSGASLFTMLAVGEKPVHAAVVPRIA